MTDWGAIRERISREIQVFYIKNTEVNAKRERDREKTINWIMDNLRLGPIKSGVLNSRDDGLPEFTWTFGDSSIWSAERGGVLMRDPVCRLCGHNPSIEVHHIRPKHLGGAPYNPRNLIGLCAPCHDEVHRKIDEGIRAVLESSLDVCLVDVDQKTLSEYGGIQ